MKQPWNQHRTHFQALYEQSLHIKSAIPHPLIMGVIRGASMHASSCIPAIHFNL